MNKIYGYDTNIYETSIGNIKKDESYITTDEITYSMLAQKIEKLQSNWNSLREYIEKQREHYRYFKDNRYRIFLSELVDKMNELEGKE